MNELTIDVGVLIDGSGIGSVPQYGKPSFALMKKVQDSVNYIVSVDHKKRIRYQYDQKLKEGTFGHHWIRLLASRNKIVPVESLHLDRGVRTALEEAHFDKEDYKYVETAAATECNILVSHDPDYSSKVRRILKKKLAVVVFDAQTCLLLEGG